MIRVMTCTTLFFLASALALQTAQADTVDLAARLQDKILETSPWSSVEVTDVRLAGPLPACAAPDISLLKPPPGPILFAVECGRTRIEGTAYAKAYDQVVMSRGAFAKGHRLREDDVYPAAMEIGRMPRGAVREVQLAVGRTLTRSVLPGAPLTDAAVSDRPVVKRGAKIFLLAAGGEFTIRAQGEIRHDAAVGDRVKAVNLQSKKTVSGMLVNENTVQVEF